MSERVNHLAVWVAAIVYYGLGFVWYAVFGRVWLAAHGPVSPTMRFTETPLLIISFLLGLILAYATAIALSGRPDQQSAGRGVAFALFMGITLYATQSFNHALYEGTPFALWLVDTGYVIVGFAVVGAIVGGWKSMATAPR